jgi:hypothetical protein
VTEIQPRQDGHLATVEFSQYLANGIIVPLELRCRHSLSPGLPKIIPADLLQNALGATVSQRIRNILAKVIFRRLDE